LASATARQAAKMPASVDLTSSEDRGTVLAALKNRGRLKCHK
jgi:hypothetical protein